MESLSAPADSRDHLDRLLPTREVAERFGYTVDGLLAAARAGRFPPPLRLARNRCVWRERDLLAHLRKLSQAAGADSDVV